MSQSDPKHSKAALTMFDFLIDLPESVRLEQLGFLADSDPELAVELSTMLDRYQQQSSVLDAQAAGAASLSGPAIHAASVRKVSTDQGLGVGRAISKRRRLKQSAETGSRRRKFAMANIIATLVLLVLATGAFSFVWSEVKEEMMFLADSQIVEGEVVGHVFVPGSDSGPMSSRASGGHFPIVRYRDQASGQEFRVQARAGAGNRQTLAGRIESGDGYHAIGSTLRVAYQRDNPADARVLGFAQQYLFPLIIFVIGLFFLMMAVLVFRDGIQ